MTRALANRAQVQSMRLDDFRCVARADAAAATAAVIAAAATAAAFDASASTDGARGMRVHRS